MSFPAVTMTEIAEFARVQRPTVSNWRRRHPSFPPPVVDDGQQPLFDAEAVATWLDLRPADGGPSYGARFRDGLKLAALAGLRGTLPGDLLLAAGVELAATGATTMPGSERIAEVVQAMLTTMGPAGTAERLIASADRLGASVRETLTPEPVAALIAALAGDVTGLTVHDPAAGLGTLLLAVLGTSHAERVLAEEVQPDRAATLRHRLTCHGIAADVLQRDSLTAGEEGRADLVVVDPPPDLPGRNWVDLAVSRLSAGGRAFVLVPIAMLSEPHSATRDGLIRSGRLRAVVQLPPRTHSYRVAMEFALLVLTCEPSPHVLLINANRLHHDWQADVGRLLVNPPATPDEAAGSFAPADLIRAGNCLPAHRLTPERKSGLGAITELISTARDLSDVAEALPLGALAPRSGRTRRTIAEYVAVGNLRLFSGCRIRAEDLDDDGVFTVTDGRTVRGRIGALALGRYATAEEVMVGDVLVAPTGDLAATVATEELTVLLSPAKSLRIVGTWMTPRVLAALLATPTNAARAGGALVRRVDIEQLSLPELMPDEVIRLDGLLRGLELRTSRAARELALLNELTATLTSGFADGVLTLNKEA